MKYDSMSNLDFFEMTQNKKQLASESKMKWEFIKHYTILALIPFVIYKIALYFINENYLKYINNFLHVEIIEFL